MPHASRIPGIATAALVWAALVASGCCAHRFTKPQRVETDAASLLRQMRERSGRVTTFEYLTRVSFYAKAGRRAGKVELLGARGPVRFRFEALTPTDDTVAVLTSDGQRFTSHERGNPVCYTGPACAANLSRLLPLPFEGAALFDLLTGGAPVIAHDTASLAWDDCQGTYRLSLRRTADAAELVMWLRPDTLGPVKLRMTVGGKERFVMQLDGFRAVNGVLLAHELKLESPIGDIDLKVEIREAFLNQVKELEKVFAPTCPPGTEARELPCS